MARGQKNGFSEHRRKETCRYATVIPVLLINKLDKYYTIIDFNEVDIRIYLPEKVIIH